MKHVLIVSVLLGLLFVVACKKDSSSNNPVASGAANVTFAISHQQGQQGGIVFLTKPSVDVRVTRVIATLPAQQYRDTLTDPTPTEVASKDNWYPIEEYTGVQSGQQWSFNFVGTIAASGAAYNTTSNYTVP